MSTIEKKNSFFEFIKNILGVFAIVSAGFGVGIYYQSMKVDNTKKELEKSVVTLIDSIARLHVLLQSDTIAQRNFIRLNTHYLYFNVQPNDYSPLDIANSTTSVCLPGEFDGCWKKEISAKEGDTVAIQFSFKNDGNFTVSGVSLGYRISYINNRTISIIGGIAVGNIIAKSGVVHIFSKSPIRIIPIQNSSRLTRTRYTSSESIEEETLFGLPNFKLGAVPTGDSAAGILITFFRIRNNN